MQNQKDAMNLFKNGNRRIARLVIWQLFAGVLIMVLGQILANLPSQDWMSPHAVKITAFALGTLLTLVKGMEMFFNKTAAMFKSHEIPDDPETPDQTQTPSNP